MCLGTSFPELSIDELRCRFFGVVDGDEGVAAVAGRDGLAGGDSNGSGGGGPFFLCTKTDMRGGGMDLYRVCGQAFSRPSSPGKLQRGDLSRPSASRRVSFLTQ